MKREVTRVRRTFALTSPKSVWSYIQGPPVGISYQWIPETESKRWECCRVSTLATGIKYKEIVAAFRQTHERRYVLITLVKKKKMKA